MQNLEELLAMLQMSQNRISQGPQFSLPTLPQPGGGTSVPAPSDGKTTTPGGTTTPPATPNVASIDRQIRMMRIQMQAIPFQLKDPVQIAQAQAAGNQRIEQLEAQKVQLGALAAPVPEAGTPISGGDGSTPGAAAAPGISLGGPSPGAAPGTVASNDQGVPGQTSPGAVAPAGQTSDDPGAGFSVSNDPNEAASIAPNIAVNSVNPVVDPGFGLGPTQGTPGLGVGHGPDPGFGTAAYAGAQNTQEAPMAGPGVTTPGGYAAPAGVTQGGNPNGPAMSNAIAGTVATEQAGLQAGQSVMSGNMGLAQGEKGGPTFTEAVPPGFGFGPNTGYGQTPSVDPASAAAVAAAVAGGVALAGETGQVSNNVGTAADAVADAFSGGDSSQADAGVTGGGFSGFSGGDGAGIGEGSTADGTAGGGMGGAADAGIGGTSSW